MRIHQLVSRALLALAAGASPALAQAWEKPDHTPPSVTDTSYCREESRRQAGTLYPGQAANDAIGRPAISDQRNFSAEIKFYEQCMTRLGYVRAEPAK